MNSQFKLASLTLAAAAMLSACGGGSSAASDDPPPAAAALVRAAGHAVAVELDDPRFLEDELRRLDKRLAALDQDLARAGAKLGNPKFLERASPEVVEAEREKHEALEEEASAVRARLERLRGLLA